MTEQKRAALRRLIQRHTRRTTVSREAAKESLIRDGFCTPEGRLAPEYVNDPSKLAVRA